MKSQHLGMYTVITKNASLLLVLKTRGPYCGLWDLPGGSPEHGESPEQTANREVREETGICVTALSNFAIYSTTIQYKHHDTSNSLHHIGLIYLADEWDETEYCSSIVKEDVAQAQWHRLAGVKEEELTPFAYKAAKSLLANPLLW